jgi:hypothetical protein
MIELEELKRVLRQELYRQNQDMDRQDAPYLYNERLNLIGVDGYIDLEALAKAVLKAIGGDKP